MIDTHFTGQWMFYCDGTSNDRQYICQIKIQQNWHYANDHGVVTILHNITERIYIPKIAGA